MGDFGLQLGEMRIKVMEGPFYDCLMEWAVENEVNVEEDFFIRLLDKYEGYEEDMYRALSHKYSTSRPRWPPNIPPKPARLAPGNLIPTQQQKQPEPPRALPYIPPDTSAPVVLEETPPSTHQPAVRHSPLRLSPRRPSRRKRSAYSPTRSPTRSRSGRRAGVPERRLDYQGVPRVRQDFRTEKEWRNAPPEATLLRDRSGNLLPRKTPVFLAKRPCDTDDDAFVCARCPSCSAVLDLLVRPDALHVDEILTQLSQSYLHIAQLEAALDTAGPARSGKEWHVQPSPPPPRGGAPKGGPAGASSAVHPSQDARDLAAEKAKSAALGQKLTRAEQEVQRLKDMLVRTEARVRAESQRADALGAHSGGAEAGASVRGVPGAYSQMQGDGGAVAAAMAAMERLQADHEHALAREREGRDYLEQALLEKSRELEDLREWGSGGGGGGGDQGKERAARRRSVNMQPDSVDVIPIVMPKDPQEGQQQRAYHQDKSEASGPVTVAPVVITDVPQVLDTSPSGQVMSSLLARAAPNTLARMQQRGSLSWDGS